MRRKQALLMCALVGAAWHASPATAQGTPVLLRDSFPIGSGEGILCQVQDRSVGNAARQTIFDRRWAVVCRDSALPVATVFAFRGTPNGAEARIAPLRREEVDCSGAVQGGAGEVEGIRRRQCKVAGTALDWSVFALERGGTTYLAEGFSAYDSATLLALRSVAGNAIAEGRIDIATTSVSDPLAFARLQAETLQPQRALAEGYRRNLGGEYAEAAAYFETLQNRLSGVSTDGLIGPGEFVVNRALQKSNLGDLAEADRLFIEAMALTAGDPVSERLQRNFEAIHFLNQGYAAAAVERLETPLSEGLQSAADAETGLEITIPIAMRLNAEGSGLFGFVDEFSLTPEERAEIIDAQAMQLKGTALRLLGRDEEAKSLLLDSYGRASAVRDGRVTSITRLSAQVMGELAAIAERQGDAPAAESYLRNGLALLSAHYPERRAVSGAKARLASLLLRQGRESEAVTLYREVLDDAIGRRAAMTGFANQLTPFFRFAAERVERDPAYAEDFFKATQVLIRPGVAETQAILARELSAKSDEAARLFRQSVDMSRDIERLRIRNQALAGGSQAADVTAERAEIASRIEQLEQDQRRTQAALSAYPQYRALAPSSLSLADFRAALMPGEAYARLALVGGEAYMFYTDRERAKAWKLSLSERALDTDVDLLRASISMLEGGRYVTYPFEIASARRLYRQMFGPIAQEIERADHLIFEPDGGMLRLPIDILVADDASVEAYARRVAADGDPFDFTGVNWLGRGTEVSTAVSAQAFVDARNSPRSRATREYLGLGNNEPIGSDPPANIRAQLVSGSDRCGWTANEWNHPIDPAELLVAQGTVGERVSELLTGANFTDQAIKAKTDLDQYRILHFATHGLVTPPAPSCPARPALLTSFGEDQSDGLLSFEEIFDLDLDADLVILSACDTAGAASIEATRDAGVGSGGGTALDGLVRAFIGAGGRAVLASHWPAPDQFNATERLMNGLFLAGRSQDLGGALRASQRQLMDDPLTSHPYYWGGFAIVGDAARPLLSESLQAEVAADPDESAGG